MTATLHFICGKIAAGKSTLTAELGQRPGTVVLSEDDLLSKLYGDQMRDLADYVRCSAALRTAMAPHVVTLLRLGVSVVLDFPANTLDTRAWMRSILDQTDAAHELHFLDVSDEVCLARLRARNDSGTHPFSVTEAQFHKVTKHFAPPTSDEGFNVVVHRSEGGS